MRTFQSQIMWSSLPWIVGGDKDDGDDSFRQQQRNWDALFTFHMFVLSNLTLASSNWM